MFRHTSMWGASVQDTISVAVYFHQGDADFDASFRGNGPRLESFARHVRELSADRTVSILSIRIVGGASPEGRTDYQKTLSENRADCLERRLRACHALLSEFVEIEPLGIDWDGLTRLVEDSNMPYRSKTLDILLYTPEWIRRNGAIVDGRKQQLRLLSGGRAWEYMYNHFFPDLRKAVVEIIYEKSEEVAEERYCSGVVRYVPCSCQTIVCRGPSCGTCSCFTTVCRPSSVRKTLPIAVKTNALYDFCVVPNIGVEIGIAGGLTIGGEYMNIWLRDRAWTKWHRLEGFEAELKYYMNDEARPFVGHHIGFYGQMLTWDFTIDGRGYLAERWACGVGVSYGYTIPVGRRLNLDFEIGIGCLSGKMHEYIPQDGHRVWQKSYPFDYVGPTKVGVTLQWLIGRENHNGGK